MAYPGVPSVGMGGMGNVPVQPPQQQEKFDSAIEFLERVKVVYADQPAVYNQFLDIMKGFKTHTIDTTGVIRRVKSLFKGHPELTRGFAAFLPKEYKIEVQDAEDEPEDAGMDQMQAQHAHAQQQQQALAQQRAAAAAQAQQAAHQQAAQQQRATMGGAGGGAGGAGGAGGGGEVGEVGEEHARLYVKKIKNRFVNQPNIYKNFLEILHTFHREKHSIQEVYSQVATLFRDHPDLLQEFAHFLPDPNAQAPAPLQQHGAYPQQHGQHGMDDHHMSHHKAQQRGTRGAARMPMTEPSSRSSSRAGQQLGGPAQASLQQQQHVGAANRGMTTMGSSRGGANAAGNQMQAPPLHAPGAVAGQVAEPGNKERSHGTFDELMHFFKLKELLPQNDYEEFLKLLSMYNADVLSKAELFFMVRDLLRHQDMELLDWFRKFMQVEDLKDDEPQGYLADYDWSTSEKLGPSYRSMPRPWASWKCSGRQGNTICQEVLNDAWISVPTGSEDGAFKNSRKNQYEELLFKCEDDRFELDLLVEGNASAIRSLEILLASFKNLSPSALATFQLNESDIDVLTIKAIRRVYTARAEEFIKMIMGKPAVAIPVVLARLKTKDTEWNVARREWNVLWKQVFKKNYHKQLDHRSTTFKQEEKKMLTAKALLAELRRASSEKPNGTDGAKPGSSSPSQTGAAGEEVANAMTASGGGNAMEVDDGKNGNAGVLAAAASASSQSAVGSPTLSFVISSTNLFADIRALLKTTFGAQLPKADLDKFDTLWDSLICAFFHVDTATKTLVPDATEANGGGDAATSSATTNGDSASHSSMDVDVPIVAPQAIPAIKLESTSSSTPAVLVSSTPISTTGTPGPNSAPNKPIATELASKPSTHHMLFLGNDSFYLLFRFLQILYDRLNEAWQFSEEFPPIHNTPLVEVDPKLPVTELPAPLTTSNGITNPAAVKAEPNAEISAEGEMSEPQPIIYVEQSSPVDSRTRYQNFLRFTEQLILGQLDQPTFEENCRHEFGISCFPLFTIDKLLLLLAKQIHTVNSDDTSEKLAGLYHYEVSRNMGGFTDAVYLSNCREVLSNDKHAYVFTYDWSSDSQILGITEVDLGHPSFGLEHNEELSRYINRLATHESILAAKRARAGGNTLNASLKPETTASGTVTPAEGASSGVNGLAPSDGGRDSPSPPVPFLRRNINGDATLEDDANGPIMQNELGVKIVAGSFKLRFVGGTEDSLQRPGRNTSHAVSEDKIALPALTDNASLPSPMDS